MSGSIRIGVEQIPSLDPISLPGRSAHLAAKQIYETLVKVSPNGDLEPGLATRWKVLDGGSRFEFQLRPARFHSGRPMEPQDVRSSLSRLVRKQSDSGSAFLLQDVVGSPEVSSGVAQDLEGVKVTGPSTIEIALTSPWHEFPYVLTNIATSITPREATEADPASLRTAPIGTGPYMTAAPLAPGTDVDLVRWRGYWGPRAPVSGVRMLQYEDVDSAWRDFERGRLDIAETPAGQVSEAKARFGTRGFVKIPSSLLLAVNVSAVPDAEERIRMARSIERDRIAAEAFEGTAVALRSLVPEGVASTERVRCQPCSQEGAVRRVSEAGPLTLGFVSGGPMQRAAEMVAASLTSAGFEVAAVPRDLPAFSESLVNRTDSMFLVGWPGEYAAADWFLTPLLRGSSPDNHTGYANPELDAELVSARAAADAGARSALYASVQGRALRDLPLIPIVQFTSRFAAAKRLRSLRIDSSGLFEVAMMRPDL